MDACREQYNTLSERAQDHRHDKNRSPSVRIRIRGQNKETNEHSYHVAGANQPHVFRRLAQKIKFLNPIIDIFRICFIKPKEILVHV